MGSPILWGPTSATNLQPGLQFNGSAGPSILTGTVNPSVSATSAVTGSLYLNTSTAISYQKQDNGSTTNWIQLGIGGVNNVIVNGNAQSCGALSAFGYATTVVDTNSNYNSGTARFTPTIAGFYQVNARLYINAALNILLYKNGALYSQGVPGTTAQPSSVSDIVYLNGTTDYIYIYTDASGTTTGGAYLNQLTISLIDGASAGGGAGTGITRSINSISSPTTAGATALTDYVYLVSGTTTLTLPTAVSNTNLYTVKNTGVNTVTIATTSAQTIDGSSTASLPVANTSLDLISDGSNWRVL